MGQEEVVEQVLVSVFSGGHCLLVGVPGLAKTLLVNTIAQALGLSFNRIQFTPDLMPSDIIGSEILDEQRRFQFNKGPLFSNIILADEINRTPPKTQSALLEAMQERAVTAAGQRHELPHPFFVLATQNPIEQEGTYPLPEAQLDRFMFNVWVDYPEYADELEVVKRTTGGASASVNAVLSSDEIAAFQQHIRKMPVADNVVEYAVKLAAKTRPGREHAPTRSTSTSAGVLDRAPPNTSSLRPSATLPLLANTARHRKRTRRSPAHTAPPHRPQLQGRSRRHHRREARRRVGLISPSGPRSSPSRACPSMCGRNRRKRARAH